MAKQLKIDKVVLLQHLNETKNVLNGLTYTDAESGEARPLSSKHKKKVCMHLYHHFLNLDRRGESDNGEALAVTPKLERVEKAKPLEIEETTMQ